MVKRELFELIKSMTMSEKRYFKIYSSKHIIGGKNDYVYLFDAIDHQEDFDDDFLKKQSFVKNLSAEKNYLHKLILKALVAFNSTLNSKVKINGLLQSAEVLYHKGLYKQAEKQCKKAFTLAQDGELFAHKVMALELLIELTSKQFRYGDAIDAIDEMNIELGSLKNFLSIQELTTKAYRDQWEIGFARSEEDTIVLKKYIKDPVNSFDGVQSERARMYLLGLNLTYAFYMNDTPKMKRLSEDMNDLYEAKPHLIEYSTIGYISSLYNTASAFLKNEQFEKALTISEKLEELKDMYGIGNSLNKGARVFFYATIVKLDGLLKLDRYNEIKIMLNDVLEGVKKFTGYISPVHHYELQFLLSKYYIVIGDYREALKRTNIILNDAKQKQRKDLLAVVRLLNLLVHYEMGNDFTLDYLTKNTYNYFKSKERLFKVEKELIRFLSGRNRDLHNDKYAKDLKQLHEAMRSYKKDSFEAVPFNYFDFEYWAKSKIEGNDLLEYGKG